MAKRTIERLQEVVIKFAGDSGDGMQLTGGQFTNTAALVGNDLGTFPDFPAEIRAPQGTLAGVSGFQINFGSKEIFTPGDQCDVLVAMNAAALKVNLNTLRKGGTIIVNTSGFDAKNLKLAGYASNPLDDGSLEGYNLIRIDITKLTREATADITDLGLKEKDRCKNMFVLGFLFWMFDRPMDYTLQALQNKFAKNPSVLEANVRALKAGYNYGDTTETFTTRYRVEKAPMAPGEYRNIMGNQALALGLVAAAQKSGLKLFLGSYPITPASDILHELARYKNFGVITFQAEDEIAGICSAIGAAFGGNIGVTTTSGPGMALKTEAIGLAVMLELPLVICNIQRGGPSTGLPTKTEQADLLQALYGRNGECPLPVLAACSPADCFDTVYEAVRIALNHMTPVIFLSDGYLANGSEPWRFPTADQLPEIKVVFAEPRTNGTPFLPYQRDERLVRPWARPGTKGLEHRIGGLEKEDITGNISYEPENHEHMVKVREAKVERIADFIPLQTTEGPEQGEALIVGWGGTYGAIKAAVQDLNEQGYRIAQTHLRYLKPFPKNLGEILHRYPKVIVPEINNGQLIKVLRDKYLVPAVGINKIQGIPFTKAELVQRIKELVN
ncbi:MAG: 2-oxoacid:acceptor oxidoreductase subunit alpha [Chitinophagales bacterium]|nr:2-oxoacid:acceptor oxidoreductase subunit alpha [Chitinophagales bacterium]MDW8428675.1 2-oxoacid:acceptor oxidoreductase subunit alpha [Chitinophagales bacterium]